MPWLCLFLKDTNTEKGNYVCNHGQFSSKSSNSIDTLPPSRLVPYRQTSLVGQLMKPAHHTRKSQTVIAFISARCNFVPVSIYCNWSNFSSILGTILLSSLFDKLLISGEWKTPKITATVMSGSTPVTCLWLIMVVLAWLLHYLIGELNIFQPLFLLNCLRLEFHCSSSAVLCWIVAVIMDSRDNQMANVHPHFGFTPLPCPGGAPQEWCSWTPPGKHRPGAGRELAAGRQQMHLS